MQCTSQFSIEKHSGWSFKRELLSRSCELLSNLLRSPLNQAIFEASALRLIKTVT